MFNRLPTLRLSLNKIEPPGTASNISIDRGRSQNITGKAKSGQHHSIDLTFRQQTARQYQGKSVSFFRTQGDMSPRDQARIRKSLNVDSSSLIKCDQWMDSKEIELKTWIPTSNVKLALKQHQAYLDYFDKIKSNSGVSYLDRALEGLKKSFSQVKQSYKQRSNEPAKPQTKRLRSSLPIWDTVPNDKAIQTVPLDELDPEGALEVQRNFTDEKEYDTFEELIKMHENKKESSCHKELLNIYEKMNKYGQKFVADSHKLDLEINPEQFKEQIKISLKEMHQTTTQHIIKLMERQTSESETQTTEIFYSKEEFREFNLELTTALKKQSEAQQVVKKLRAKLKDDAESYAYYTDREKKATAEIIMLNRQVESQSKQIFVLESIVQEKQKLLDNARISDSRNKTGIDALTHLALSSTMPSRQAQIQQQSSGAPGTTAEQRQGRKFTKNGQKIIQGEQGAQIGVDELGNPIYGPSGTQGIEDKDIEYTDYDGSDRDENNYTMGRPNFLGNGNIPGMPGRSPKSSQMQRQGNQSRAAPSGIARASAGSVTTSSGTKIQLSERQDLQEKQAQFEQYVSNPEAIDKGMSEVENMMQNTRNERVKTIMEKNMKQFLKMKQKKKNSPGEIDEDIKELEELIRVTTDQGVKSMLMRNMRKLTKKKIWSQTQEEIEQRVYQATGNTNRYSGGTGNKTLDYASPAQESKWTLGPGQVQSKGLASNIAQVAQIKNVHGAHRQFTSGNQYTGQSSNYADTGSDVMAFDPTLDKDMDVQHRNLANVIAEAGKVATDELLNYSERNSEAENEPGSSRRQKNKWKKLIESGGKRKTGNPPNKPTQGSSSQRNITTRNSTNRNDPSRDATSLENSPKKSTFREAVSRSDSKVQSLLKAEEEENQRKSLSNAQQRTQTSGTMPPGKWTADSSDPTNSRRSLGQQTTSSSKSKRSPWKPKIESKFIVPQDIWIGHDERWGADCEHLRRAMEYEKKYDREALPIKKCSFLMVSDDEDVN